MRGITNVPPQADGVNAHAATHYADGNDPIDMSKLGAIPATDKGKANGVATLDETGNVPCAQLGNAVNKAGDMMTGALELSSDAKGDARIWGCKHGLYLVSGKSGEEQWQFFINNVSGTSAISDTLTTALILARSYDGITWGEVYNVLHTGNLTALNVPTVTAGTADLTAGTTALATGSIYQVYE